MAVLPYPLLGYEIDSAPQDLTSHTTNVFLQKRSDEYPPPQASFRGIAAALFTIFIFVTIVGYFIGRLVYLADATSSSSSSSEDSELVNE